MITYVHIEFAVQISVVEINVLLVLNESDGISFLSCQTPI